MASLLARACSDPSEVHHPRTGVGFISRRRGLSPARPPDAPIPLAGAHRFHSFPGLPGAQGQRAHAGGRSRHGELEGSLPGSAMTAQQMTAPIRVEHRRPDGQVQEGRVFVVAAGAWPPPAATAPCRPGGARDGTAVACPICSSSRSISAFDRIDETAVPPRDSRCASRWQTRPSGLAPAPFRVRPGGAAAAERGQCFRFTPLLPRPQPSDRTHWCRTGERSPPSSSAARPPGSSSPPGPGPGPGPWPDNASGRRRRAPTASRAANDAPRACPARFRLQSPHAVRPGRSLPARQP